MENNVIETTKKLYYEANPNTKMDVPSFAFELVEKSNKRRIEAKSALSLYDWYKFELKHKK